MEYVREGDVVGTESISRIARNTRDLLTIVETLKEKHVEFVSLKENIDTNTPTGQFMLTVFAAMAQLERESILQRQAEGIAIAKVAGKHRRKALPEGRRSLEGRRAYGNLDPAGVCHQRHNVLPLGQGETALT